MVEQSPPNDLTLRCPFCSNVVIVPPELRTASTAAPAAPAADSTLRTLGQLPQWAEIGRLVKDGSKIEAIKLFRELTGAYVGEYDSGRVQVFDSTGEFIDQWKIEQTDTFLRKMAVGRDGTVYTVVDGSIYKYEGLTGKLLGKVAYRGGRVLGCGDIRH